MSTGSTVKCAALDCASSLKTVAIRVIQEINPYFLFFRGTQMGGGQRGAKPKMGGMTPSPPLAPPLSVAACAYTFFITPMKILQQTSL